MCGLKTTLGLSVKVEVSILGVQGEYGHSNMRLSENPTTGALFVAFLKSAKVQNLANG